MSLPEQHGEQVQRDGGQDELRFPNEADAADEALQRHRLGALDPLRPHPRQGRQRQHAADDHGGKRRGHPRRHGEDRAADQAMGEVQGKPPQPLVLQREDRPADGRSGHRGNVEDAAVPGDGVGKDLRPHDLRQQGRPGRGAEGLADGPQRQQGVDPRHPSLMVSDRQQPHRDQGVQGEREHQQAAAIEAVGQLPAGHGQQQHRQGLHQSDPAQRHRVVRQVVEVRPDGERLDHAAEGHQDQRPA